MTETSDQAALAKGGLTDDGLLDRIRSGPDPEGTLRRLARFARKRPEAFALITQDESVAGRLVALAGGSRALMETLMRAADPGGALAAEPGGLGPEASSLGQAVRLGLARIAAGDLAGEIDMPEAGRLVSQVADRATELAMSDLAGDEPPVAVVAMGKWGGQELNYASDIDLVFVHAGDDGVATSLATDLVQRLAAREGDGGAYRVDTALRPEGSSGPLTRTLDSYRRYWERWAETWELQALLKARVVAGDLSLGHDFIEAASQYVFPERLGADAVRAVRTMKARAEGLVETGPTELKRGVGGIRDVEFAIQLLQLVHGRADPSLRAPNTLEGLDRLAAGGYVLREDAEMLAESYRWLRDTEHRIQLFELRQTHTLPTDPEGRERVARALGFRDQPDRSALDAFDVELARRRADVRSIHEQLFHRPVLEALAESRAGALTAEAAATRLAAFGFVDTDSTRTALADLTSGLSRRSGLMRHMLPVIMEWLSLSPDPDLGLTQLRRLVEESGDAGSLVATLRDDPLAAERLCTALGTSRLVARLLDRLPPLIPLFGDDAALSEWSGGTALTDEAIARVEVHADPVTALHAFHAEHLLSTAVADLAGVIGDDEVAQRLSDVADATVNAAVRLAVGDGKPMFGVVALGKWGGRELNYASDLDAVVVTHDGADPERAAAAVERIIGILGAGRAGFRSLALDLDLRPEGRKGVLVRSLDGYRRYWSRWAATWELQAMLRARPAAGDLGLAARLIDAAAGEVFAPRADLVSDVRTMKARVETERIHPGEDPLFHLKLGKGGMSDVEWTVQLLQMNHGGAIEGVRTPSTLRGLEALEEHGLLQSEDSRMLAAAYRFCARVRNRLFLRTGRSADALPTDPDEVTRLARSLGYSLHPRSALREEYRRVTRRARRVVDRVFYGIGGPGGDSSA